MAFVRILKDSLGLDYRSMALYRVLIGLCVCADVIYRLPDLVNFYTDKGLIPRALFLNEMALPWSFSFHLGNGSLGYAVLLFSIHLLFGIMLVLGYKYRIAIIGAFLMTASVHNRNWLVNNGGDDILRAILFLSIFLPLNKCFSIDSGMQKPREDIKDPTHISFWVLAFTFQVFAIYFVSYVLKDHAIWRRDYSAIYFASRLDIFSTPFGFWFRQFHFLQKLGTIYTIYLEWLGPLLLVFSWVLGRQYWIGRTLVVLLFWGLHLGIIATMYIGVFPWICLAMWTTFLPGRLWDIVLGHFRQKGYGKITLYFDADCRFCEKGVHLVREFLLLRESTIAETQSSPEIFGLMKSHHSWVFVSETGERFFKYDAFVEMSKRSPLIFWLAPVIGSRPVRWVGDAVYHWVSHHRSTMGLATQHLLFSSPKKPIRPFRWLKEGIGALLLITLVAWNLSTIKRLNFRAGVFGDVARWLHLYQEWNMFSPYPKLDNVWVEVTGELSDGTSIDVLSGSRDIFAVRDQAFLDTVENEHWRKFYLNLPTKNDYARYFGAYLCRRWNERNIRWVPETTLRKMEVATFSQMNFLNDERGPVEKKMSWKHWCFDADYARDNAGSKRPK